MEWWKFVIICVIGYMFGNINFARIISATRKKDITTMGSGNPGTMNVLRNLGAFWAAMTLIGDVVKSVIPSIIGLVWIGRPALYAGGLSAVVGHIYPVVYKFKGGKGVASAIGVFAVAYPLVMAIGFAGGFIFLYFSKYASITSLILITAMSIYAGYTEQDLAVRIMIFSIWILVWFGHRTNIINAIIGKERKTDLAKAFSKIKTGNKKNKKTEKTEA